MSAFGEIIKLNKGTVTTAHSGITASVAAANCTAIETKMNNAVLVGLDIDAGSGAWTVKLQGALASDGVYKDLYDTNGNLMSTGSISAARIQLFVGVPEFIKVVPTEDTNGATVTIKVQPISV